MIWMILGALIGVVISVTLCRDKYTPDVLGDAFAGSVSGVIGAVLGLLVAITAGIFLCTPDFPQSTYSLRQVGIDREGETHGSFFLGCGSIKGSDELQYTFYFVRGDGGLVPSTRSIRECIVYEDATEDDAHVVIVWRSGADFTWWVLVLDQEPPGRCVEFHVPPGSVRNVGDLNFVGM